MEIIIYFFASSKRLKHGNVTTYAGQGLLFQIVFVRKSAARYGPVRAAKAWDSCLVIPPREAILLIQDQGLGITVLIATKYQCLGVCRRVLWTNVSCCEVISPSDNALKDSGAGAGMAL